MPHQAGHTWGDLISSGFDKGKDFLDDYGTLVGAAGQLASSEKAVEALEGLGEKAVETIGMPKTDAAGNPVGIYDTVKSDTIFKPFTVTGLPTGTINTDAMGGTEYSLSPEQEALATSLRTGGSTLIDAILGRNEFGTPDPITGEMKDDARSGMGYLQKLLGDPFKAENLAKTEQSTYDRLREIRTPEEERAQIALNSALIAGGRQGLQTSQYGGSPEQFALSKAIEEQKSKDVVSAMGLAREDAQAQANANAGALTQMLAEKGFGVDALNTFLDQSYAPQSNLLASIMPSIQLSDIVTASGRDLGNYGMNLGNALLNYDLGTRGAAANLRNQTLQGLFDLLIADKTAKGNVAAAQAGGINTGNPGLDAALNSISGISEYGFKLPGF